MMNIHRFRLQLPCFALLTGKFPELNVLQARHAGHSKWSNIKFKKMIIDNARAKVFGKMSLEIIQAVKENGADPSHNSKLDGLILKAKSISMPKDKIETSIKNALRNSTEKRSKLLLQARGPGKCGLLLDVLTPNAARSKHEIKGILKKNEVTYIEDGSVLFMFEHKGVVAVDGDSLSKSETEGVIKEMAEEIAIMIEAENVLFADNDGRKVFQFICEPMEVIRLQKQLQSEYSNLIIQSADVQYLAKTLIGLPDELMHKTDKLINTINEHPDVLNVYDNVIGYPSSTIKLTNHYEEFT
ncbi:probable transcriptional regulatory protein TTE1135 isoform X2 [Hydractinia symbiolongicarpus]|uniref:probable transcriptional regulatory protein TTE1135 isoform X2 n=1 Tax=Hydractinia symbiolongicarpus TaxID=13093 RepID=UPI00254EB824|nr:probable transcriptional regulatory protein TTE1135 isoform X2 [Hydractinia symbiolongicarpus]